jgi:ribosomal protein S6
VDSFGRCAILLAAALYACAFLTAQDKDAVTAQIDQTKKFISQRRAAPEYRDSIRESVLAYEKSLDAHCNDVVLDFDSAGVRDKILDLLNLDDKGVAIEGIWREIVPGSACGEPRRLTVQVDVTRQGLHYTALFPGESDCDSELQQDTLKNIELNFQALRIQKKKSCHLEVVETHLVGPEATMQDNGILSQWKESWDVRTCGKVYVVPLTYIPDNHGTSISVATSEIHPQ